MESPETSTAIPAHTRQLRSVLAVALFGGTALVILHDWLGLGGAELDTATSGWLMTPS